MGQVPKLPRLLAKYLGERLDGAAGTRQLVQGERSTLEYKRMLAERMPTPSGRGTRKLFMRSSAEIFEAHGRLLAYVAPTYEPEECAVCSHPNS